MPRRNNRPRYEPVDLTPPIEERNWPSSTERKVYSAEQLAKRAREREESQRQARMRGGIDWSVCIVPGCGKHLITWGGLEHWRPERRDPSLELPICYEHAAVIWKQLAGFHVKEGKFLEAIADVREGVAARETREHEAEKTANLANVETGVIYFIRIGELVKVGWTRSLFDRLKSYGASAELVVSYPGSHADETSLHRQLRPALAKGREWYHDGPIIKHFIDEALNKYGPPQTFEFLWTQPKQVVAGKRVNRTV